MTDVFLNWCHNMEMIGLIFCIIIIFL